MINRRNIEPYIMYVGYLHYNYIHSPIKKLWLRWKYRKLSREVRRKYLK